MLQHSKEVAWLAGMMAAELRPRRGPRQARRRCCTTSGKVLTHENEGTHVELGVEVARKYGETPVVVGCIAAHHDDGDRRLVRDVVVMRRMQLMTVAFSPYLVATSTPSCTCVPSFSWVSTLPMSCSSAPRLASADVEPQLGRHDAGEAARSPSCG